MKYLKAGYSKVNNTLGLSYIRAIDELSSGITPLTIPREGNRFADDRLSESRFSSATSLRRTLEESRVEDAARFMPEALAQKINASGTISNEDIFNVLLPPAAL